MLLLLLIVMIMMMMMTIIIIIVVFVIIMDFGLGCTLSAGNSPLSVLTKVKKKWLMTSMDPQYETPWKFVYYFGDYTFVRTGRLATFFLCVCLKHFVYRARTVLPYRLFIRATKCRGLSTVLM